MTFTNKFTNKKRIEALIENKTTLTLNNAEIQIFETNQYVNQFLLKFNEPVFLSMLEGKKIMHLDGMKPFDFLPGETIILPPDELICVDFPEARIDNPTRCLTLTVSDDKIMEIANYLNEEQPKLDNNWQFIDYNFHFTNNQSVQNIIQRLLHLFSENHPSKDIFTDFMLKELIIRVLQEENKKKYIENSIKLNENDRLAYIIQYIHQNIDRPLTIKELSDKIHLSESHFHRTFKQELDVSPIDFIKQERIKLATILLQDPQKQIKEVSLQCGFNSLSYFIRTFKKMKGMTPKEYQMSINNKRLS